MLSVLFTALWAPGEGDSDPYSILHADARAARATDVSDPGCAMRPIARGATAAPRGRVSAVATQEISRATLSFTSRVPSVATAVRGGV